MKNISTFERSTENASPDVDRVSSNTRSLIHSCMNGVGAVASTAGFVAGKTVQIGLKTSAAVVRGLLS